MSTIHPDNTTSLSEVRSLAGYRAHKVDANGTLSICFDGREQGLSGDEDWRWVVTCEKHDTLCSFSTLKVARTFLGCTDEFCDGCRDEAEAADQVAADQAEPSWADQVAAPLQAQMEAEVDAAFERWAAEAAEADDEERAYQDWLADHDDHDEDTLAARDAWEEHLDDLVHQAEQRDEDGLWAAGCGSPRTWPSGSTTRAYAGF